MKLTFEVPAWFDEWNNEVDRVWDGLNTDHLDIDHFKTNKIKMLSQVGYGFPLVTDVNIQRIDRSGSDTEEEPGFSTGDMTVEDITRYVKENRFKLIDAIIHGYEIERD